MAIFKCKMCGATLEVEENQSIAICKYCGSQQTLPKIDDERKVALFNRANNLRIKNEFDKAAGIYESIIAEFPDEAEAYWGLVLCKYGIEYVDDPASAKKVPTCHRTLPTPIMRDEDFQQACENADIAARGLYREEAKAIDGIQKKILEIAATEELYDIFICYKETDDVTGIRTDDSSIAQDIYTAFTEMGYKVFYARNSLRKVAGTEYEPYIYAALSSAKIMLAIGTKYEYYDAVWVKNEWSRFISMMANDSSKVLIPCFKNIDAYDIPEEFSNMQALDMADMMFFSSLEASVKRILPLETKTKIEETEHKTSTPKTNCNSREIAFKDGYYIGEAVADQPNGYGTRVWSDGSRYEGEWKFGKQDGQGTFYNKDGSTWIGTFKDGKNWAGKGTLHLSNGDIYVGEFVDGECEGYGIYWFADGKKYEGKYKHGKFDGQGTIHLINGDVYTGEFVDGKREGKGKVCYVNGDTYEGEFEDDNPEGEGTYTYTDGSIWTGEFIIGKKWSGKGVTYYDNGDKYVGQLLYGKRNGEGTLTATDGSEWTGEFKDGKEWLGKGSVQLSNGDKCVGDIVNGKLNGKGKLYTQAGATYEGNFVDGKLNGKGKLYAANGDTYEGGFVNNELEGYGMHTYKDGNIWSGEFKNGGIWNGKGLVCYTNGDKYVGQIVNGKREGHGNYSYLEGGTWTGEFKDSQFWTGEGTIYYNSGAKYEGELVNGEKNGQGKYTHKDGSTWTGEFKDNKAWNGEGVWPTQDGTLLIKGKMRKGSAALFGSSLVKK